MTTTDPLLAEAQPEFSAEELRAMHRWCLQYRDFVRDGGTPSPEQDAQFRAFSTTCYATGVAYGHR